MNHLIVSLSATLGSEVYTVSGNAIAVVYDVVCNKDTGKLTCFIVCPRETDARNIPPDEVFAVHHSHFYFDDEGDVLTYSAKLGNDELNFFLDLPPQYDEADVKDVNDFNRYVATLTAVAGHRTDND